MAEQVITVKTKLEGAIRDFKRLGKSISDSEDQLKEVAVASGAAFAALVAGMGVALKQFGDFEHAMKMVKTNLDASSFADVGKSLNEGFRDLEKGALKTIQDMPIALDSATTSIFDLVSAGIPASKSLEAMRAAGKLAVAGLTDVAVATDGLTSIINAYGYEAEQAEVLSGKLFLAQKFGKTTVDEL